MGIDNDFFGLRNSENKASAHTVINEEIEEIPYRSLDNIGSSGDINTNAEDLAKWMKLHLNEGDWDGNRLLSPETISEIAYSPDVNSETRSNFVFPRGKYHHKWTGMVRPRLLRRKGSGALGQYRRDECPYSYTANRNIRVAVLTNPNANLLPFAIKNSVFDIILDEPEFDWNQTFKQSFDDFTKAREQIVNTPPIIKNKLSSSLDLSEYTGYYTSQPGEHLEIKMDQKYLLLTYGKSSGLLTHLNYNTFIIEWKDPMIKNSFGTTTLTFLLSKSGHIDEINIDGIRAFQKKK